MLQKKGPFGTPLQLIFCLKTVLLVWCWEYLKP